MLCSYKNDEEIWGSEINLQLVQISRALLNRRGLRWCKRTGILTRPEVYSLHCMNCGIGWWSNSICPEIHALPALFKEAFTSTRYRVENSVEGVVAKGCNGRDRRESVEVSATMCWSRYQGSQPSADLRASWSTSCPALSLVLVAHCFFIAALSLVSRTVCAPRWPSGQKRTCKGLKLIW